MPNRSKPPIASEEQESVPLNTIATENTGALTPDDTVKTAGDRMREQDSPTWPVVQDRKLVGTVDGKNPDWALGGHGHDPEGWQVGSIMNREAVFCYEDEDCAQAEKVMNERGLNHLPVVDRQMRIVGIFSKEEVARRAAKATVG